METETHPPQRNHPASKSKSIQCPNCGRYNPQRSVTYIHPLTGKFVSINSLYGVIITIVVFVVIGQLMITPTTQEGYYNYISVWNAACFGLLFAFAGATIAFILYYAWGRHRLRKNNITRTHYVCTYCGKEWDVVQEPTAKKLS